MPQKPTAYKTHIILLSILLLSACVRPDNSPSPFDSLITDEPQEKALPDSPVSGPDFYIIPDSELVFSPSTVGFSIPDTISQQHGFLSDYEELIDDDLFSGTEIVDRVSREYSVHPRLLLAILEMRSGWVSSSNGTDLSPYPIYSDASSLAPLFTQLSWAADILNRGFYSRRVGGLPVIWTTDGVEVHVPDSVNDATAAVQYFLGQLMGYYDWQAAVGPLGLFTQYAALFGNPHSFGAATLNPVGLSQPELSLPFSAGESWFFTSGPHSAWGTGAAWAALDLAPDEDGIGCFQSVSWVTAVADGIIARVGDGIVVQDLDGDGEEGTGWTILYMHIAEEDKVEEGVYLKQGDRIGHPSCEGGPSSGTHLHLARRYNGEWIPADQNIPFVLSGWISRGDAVEYDGRLIHGQIEIEASGFPTDENKIFH
ncbi:MAG: M23 family metallopeptidase [Pelolinea sp.]|nr:M23 family metallopeptidase [Pelolinea sp.]